MSMVDILKKSFLSEISDENLDELLKHSEIRKYPRGSIILYAGDVGRAIYFILKGDVKVILTNDEGKEIILNRFMKNDFFGEMAIFNKTTLSASVIAETSCEFLAIQHDLIEKQMINKPQIALNLLPEIFKRFKSSNEQIKILSLKDSKLKVINLLRKLLVEGKDENRINRPSTKDLAAMCGTSRETVSRVLNELKKTKKIELDKDSIIINKL